MRASTINSAIRRLGLVVVGTKGDGYFYFLSAKYGVQVGDSVMVCYLNQLTLEQWVQRAEEAIQTLERNFSAKQIKQTNETK